MIFGFNRETAYDATELRKPGSGTEVKIGDEELLIMKESDILGIVD